MTRFLGSVAAILLASAPISFVAPSQAATVTFTQLAGLTGGSPAETGVFVADLSSLIGSQVASVTIQDNSSTLAGSPGQFSGFDLDAIVLSNTQITNASMVGMLNRAGTFNFTTSVFTAGAQTPPPNAMLFGTVAGHVDNAVATLDSFDGNSTTGPTAFGFVSLGVGGALSINLDTPVALGGPLYLYIGEVGNNGEVAASSISVSGSPIATMPLPAAAPMFGAAILALGGIGYGLRRKASATV